MADNTLSGLIVTIFSALNTVAREQIGMIPSVRKFSYPGKKVAQNEPITYPIVPAFGAPSPIAATNIVADPAGIVVGNGTMYMDQVNAISFGWNGEEAVGLGNSGIFATTQEDAFKQAFRAHANQIEAALCGLYTGASRAFGTPGAVPFATKDDINGTAECRQILEDNGMWFDGKMKMVLTNSAAKNLRRFQGIVFKANERGDKDGQLIGSVTELEGFDLHQSGQLKTHTNGTGQWVTLANGWTVTGAITAAELSLALTKVSAGGTILLGDIVTFGTAGTLVDSNQYVNTKALVDSSNDNVTIANPGIMLAQTSTGLDVNIVGNNGAIPGQYTASMAFNEDAIVLVSALPNLPEGGDQAVARMTVQDPISGLLFEVSEYKGYRKIIYVVAAAWGYSLVKPEGLALLIQ